MSNCTRKPTICICENKDADQLCSNCTADQHLCFRYSDSTVPFLFKSKISSFYLFCATAQADLCVTWTETQIVGFLMHRLILNVILQKIYQYCNDNFYRNYLKYCYKCIQILNKRCIQYELYYANWKGSVLDMKNTDISKSV